jgi:hypothetical protein
MVVINCTQKLLRRSHVGRTLDVPLSNTVLGPWCANVFNIGRFPFVLLTNEKTLLSTVFPYREFKNLSFVLSESLERQLSELLIPANKIVAEVDQCSHIVFGSDTKRSVLGSMNDLVFQVKTIVEMEGKINIVDLERSMGKTPFSAIGYNSPERSVKELFVGL